MNKWGYDEMSDSQVMIGALLQIMNELRINTDVRQELAKRFAEDRSHVPLSKRISRAERHYAECEAEMKGPPRGYQPVPDNSMAKPIPPPKKP